MRCQGSDAYLNGLLHLAYRRSCTEGMPVFSHLKDSRLPSIVRLTASLPNLDRVSNIPQTPAHRHLARTQCQSTRLRRMSFTL